MERMDLDQLPRYSPWPARLLGLSQWQPVRRGLDKIENEYQRDKYAAMLERHRQGGGAATAEDVRRAQYGKPLDSEICMVWQDELYRATLREGRERLYAYLREVLGPAVERAATVVELGCGFGFNLWLLHRWHPDKQYLGGDFSANAVELARRLNTGSPNLRFQQFNFYDQDYAILDQAEPPCLVLTYHALEQVPSAGCLPAALARRREAIDRVVHFEPSYELQGDDLMGLLRRRYLEVNDYNRDLWSQLDRRPEVELVDRQVNAVGLNPMNPSTVLQWRFR